MIWGVNPVAIKLGLLDAPPLRLAALRFLVGGIVIAIWAWATGRLRGLRIEPEEWRPLIVLGLLFAMQISSMNYGTALTSASHAAILLNLYAVQTVVLAHFMIPGDRITMRRLVGALIAYGGIVPLLVREAGTHASSLTGDLIMFGSALLLGERTIYLARAVQTWDPVKLLLSQAVFATLLFSVASVAFEPEPTRWTLNLVGVMVFQGAIVSGFNFAVNLWMLKRYRPSVLAAFFLTQPLFGVIAANQITGDPLTVELAIAAVAVAVGIGLSSL